MKHTPGPWNTRKAKTPQELVFCYIDSDEANLGICKVLKDQYRTEEEAQANAKLIAAAPDLLEALEEALPGIEELNGEFQEGWGPTIELIEKAIAKAKGI